MSQRVDLLLTPVGLLVAFAAAHEPYPALLVVPLAGLFTIFAGERAARVEQTLELSGAYRGTALLLGDVIEADDEYTGQHTQDVVELTIAVADRLRVDEETRRAAEFGALLHDVGKVAIPNEIINKPGPLDEAEWAIMKTHTIEGQRMLERVGGMLARVGVVVRASHERFDGGGYPDGLAGEAIPLAARIVSACDAYNAMTTDRSYRKALSDDVAVAELRNNAGTQFDPDVVEALVIVAAAGCSAPDPRQRPRDGRRARAGRRAGLLGGRPERRPRRRRRGAARLPGPRRRSPRRARWSSRGGSASRRWPRSTRTASARSRSSGRRSCVPTLAGGLRVLRHAGQQALVDRRAGRAETSRARGSRGAHRLPRRRTHRREGPRDPPRRRRLGGVDLLSPVG